MNFCEQSGKQCHQTKAGAGAQKGHLARSGGRGDRRKVAVYLCAHCRCWHVGHQGARQMAPERVRR